MKRELLSRVLGQAIPRYVCDRLFRWSGVLVLNYHRIGDGSQSVFDRALWSSAAEAFADQVRFCKARFDVISPADLPNVLARRRGRYILITFDDGYRDNYEVAFPIVKAENVPATFFVASGFIDSPRVPWWDEIAWMVRTSTRPGVMLSGWLDAPVPFDDPDREQAIRRLLRTYKAISADATDAYLNDLADATGSGRCDREAVPYWWMTWDMLREMQSAGMTIGGHTVSHPILSQATGEMQRREIEGCSQRLAVELGRPMRCFSYPVGGFGAFDAVTKQCLREVGVQYAFSFYAGYRRFTDWDDYDIRRVPVESSFTRHRFQSIITVPQLFA